MPRSAGLLLRGLVLLVLAGAAAGCNPARVVDSVTPRQGYAVDRNVAYGADRRQRMDIYVPSVVSPRAPVVVFFYGGSWRRGTKADYRFVGQAFASRGYITAIPDYRLYPQVRWRDFLADGAAAVVAAAAQADRVGARFAGTADRPVFVVGHSAGAYIAAMLALDDRWLAATPGGSGCLIDAGAGMAGPYDFLPLDSRVLQDTFGPDPAGPETQPIAQVDADDPPMLLVSGTADDTVDPGNTRRLAAALRAANVWVETRFYPAVGHLALVGALSPPFRGAVPVLADIDGFLRTAAAQPQRRCGPLDIVPRS